MSYLRINGFVGALTFALIPWFLIATTAFTAVIYQALEVFTENDQITSFACPINLGDPFAKNVLAQGPGNWKVVSSGKSRLKVLVTNIEGSDTITPYCRLTFSGGRKEAGPSIDWRIGRDYELPADSVGKTIRASFKIRGNRTIMLNTGQLYIYDGLDVAAAGIGQLETSWKSVIVEKPIVAGSQFVEIWVRLVIGDGTIIPGEGELDFIVELTLT